MGAPVSPGDILRDLLAVIRNQFYPDDSKGWFQQRDAIILCLTRPAKWFSDRGITFPPDRYERLIQDILSTIKRHGATGQIRWFPAYLGKSVEAYLIHNGDDLYREAKGAKNLSSVALGRVRQTSAQEDIAAPLAEARRILLAARQKPARTLRARSLQDCLPGL